MLRILSKSLLVLGLSTGVAMATPVAFTFTGGTNSSTSYGNSRGYDADGVHVDANAWANTKGSSNVLIDNAYLGSYSGGLGVTNRDKNHGDDREGTSPEHSMDNNDRFDSILLSFSDTMKLTSLSIGWKYNDSDMTVLAYTGVGVPTFAGLSYGDLLGNGWSLVGNYANVALNTATSINAGGLASEYWLVGAYNPIFGGGAGLEQGIETITKNCRTTKIDHGDYIKLKTITGDKVEVDEPAAMSLLALGMAMGAVRRRRKA